jgi:hypothetical protein
MATATAIRPSFERQSDAPVTRDVIARLDEAPTTTQHWKILLTWFRDRW